MTKAGLACVVGVLLLGAAVCRAGEKVVIVEPQPCPKTPVGCKASKRATCECGRKLNIVDWLSYKPLRCKHGACTGKGEPCCTPPLYAFFLCQGTNGGTCHSPCTQAGSHCTHGRKCDTCKPCVSPTSPPCTKCRTCDHPAGGR